MGVVHQQPLGKLYCFLLKIPLYLRFFWEVTTYPNSFLGHNLSRFNCLGNGPRKPTSDRRTPEIHAAPRLPDVLTALRRPFFGNSWETTGPSIQKYWLWNTFFGLKRNVRNISKSWKWKQSKAFWLTTCWFLIDLPDMISKSAAGWRSFSVGITRAWPWFALLRPGRTVPRRSGADEGSHFLAPKFLELNTYVLVRQLNEQWMWNIKSKIRKKWWERHFENDMEAPGSLNIQEKSDEKDVSFSVATTKPFGNFPIFMFSLGTFNHPWGGWNPSYHRRRWKLVCFPKLKWTVYLPDSFVRVRKGFLLKITLS